MKQFNEERTKRKEFNEAEAAETEGAAFALDAKAAKMLPPAFRPSGGGSGGGGGGGGSDLGKQVGGSAVMDNT